ncbi:MAG: hypothetical protein QOJ19_202 [Acidimicrobiia bacterium]|nr:hypothetical protein [Acidimicrobiia bacterium]
MYSRRAVAVLAALLLFMISTIGTANAAGVADGEYRGTVIDAGGLGIHEAKENTVAIQVSGGGTQLRGSISLMFDADVGLNQLAYPVCFLARADIPPTALSGSGVSGSGHSEQGDARGVCGPAAPFETQPYDADFAITFNGDELVGSLTISATVPLVYNFRAHRVGAAPLTPAPLIPAPSAQPAAPVAGIDELIDGVGVTKETLQRIKDIMACKDNEKEAGRRCDLEAALSAGEPMSKLFRARTGQELFGPPGNPMLFVSQPELTRVALLAFAKRPDGTLVAPHLSIMFPVFLQLRLQSKAPGDRAELTFNRLLGALLAMDTVE